MREMTATTLKNTMQEMINNLKKREAKNIKDEIEKVKTIAYLVTVSSQVIDQERKYYHEDQRREEVDKRKIKWDQMEDDLLSSSTQTYR